MAHHRAFPGIDLGAPAGCMLPYCTLLYPHALRTGCRAGKVCGEGTCKEGKDGAVVSMVRLVTKGTKSPQGSGSWALLPQELAG